MRYKRGERLENTVETSSLEQVQQVSRGAAASAVIILR
jgi:hypothetical protein